MFDSPIPIVEILTENFKNINIQPKLVDVSFKILKNAQPKDCFNNAFKAQSFNSKAIYVLGYVFVHNIPIEHAWISEDDKYYDITIQPENHKYVSVAEFTLDEIFPFVEKHMHSPSLYDMNKFLSTR